MKKQNIFNVILEGVDGVGKSTIIGRLFEHYNFRYMCYHRGEMSNLVFAKKYDRQFFATQNRLPFIYIYLYCQEDMLIQRMKDRAKKERWNEIDLEHELSKTSDIPLFEEAYEKMKNDYLIYRIDTSTLTIEETTKEAVKILDDYQNSLENDEELTTWNKMYLKTCTKYNIPFKVVDNQPYIDNRPVMVEATLQNGEYETYSNKKCYDNVLYAMAYDNRNVSQINKKFDFNYIINSKIKKRAEVLDYYKVFEENELTCLVSLRNDLVKKSKYLVGQVDSFGDDYLDTIVKSKATVYCSRDLAYLKLQTARLYENILANNIVFVDKETDVENEILSNIYNQNTKEDEICKELLYVTPETIVKNYKMIDDTLQSFIIKRQYSYWEKVKQEAIDFYKKEEQL